MRYQATSEPIARYDADPTFIVIDAGDLMWCRHLGGIPSPALIQAGSEGTPVEAWRTADGQWRLRDDAWDATHKPTDVAYRTVLVGRPPRRDR